MAMRGKRRKFIYRFDVVLLFSFLPSCSSSQSYSVVIDIPGLAHQRTYSHYSGLQMKRRVPGYDRRVPAYVWLGFEVVSSRVRRERGRRERQEREKVKR